MRVTSSGHVELAVHDLGGSGPTLLISHATGFHGFCYAPMAEALADRFHCIAFDYRGHGDSALPRHVDGAIEWSHFGDDAMAMIESLEPPVAVFGHSMGAACMLMAARAHPERVSALVLFEPIVLPPAGLRDDGSPSPLAAGARRRRSTFPSFGAAIENYASKPPLGNFTRAALEAYVYHGFELGEDGQVHLKCDPETEAATFEGSGGHDTWDVLDEIRARVLVVAGRPEPMQPAQFASAIAQRLPNGQYLQLDDLDHFGPMTHPDVVAEVVADFVLH